MNCNTNEKSSINTCWTNKNKLNLLFGNIVRKKEEILINKLDGLRIIYDVINFYL
jgi:hypothetical protein